MLSPLVRRQLKTQSMLLSRRSASFTSFLPNLKGVSSETTLGEVYERVYTGYRYKLIWPVVGWIGFLYLTLWEDYTPPAEKAAQKARMDKLASLEWNDE
ncbi:hypothetical protein HDV03_000158 [Kappamyces sp. JEL0829]|nr:hypothetical protein HDV03_000158 [Kappamyces sp. JEL0829]